MSQVPKIRIEQHHQEDALSPQAEKGAPHLDDRITLRVTETEKWLLQHLARHEGLSVGRYVMATTRSTGRMLMNRQCQAAAALIRLDEARRKRTKRWKRKPTLRDMVGRFRCPFLRREHAEGFEAVIADSAKRMGITELSAARFVSFFLESIATAIATGGVVRLPGFGVFGPWYSEKTKGVDGCVPRFVAAAPLREFVQWECSARMNRNRELQAVRRRRRRRRSSVVDAMETLRRHIGSQNQEAQAAFEKWIEMGW